jgi:hypothetical protein
VEQLGAGKRCPGGRKSGADGQRPADLAPPSR